MAKLTTVDLPLPVDDRFETRLEWANERLADLAEGILTPDVGMLVWAIVEGWCDIGHSRDEVRQFHAMAKRIADLCSNLIAGPG